MKNEYIPRPEWMRKKKQLSKEVIHTRAKVHAPGLHTVCEEARCPNLTECYKKSVITFLILGDVCTRNCRFCSVRHGTPETPDPEEGKKIGEYCMKQGIGYLVLTSVTRDDLPLKGAAHFCRVVQDIRVKVSDIRIELLVPDFQGSTEAMDKVIGLNIEVIGHNLETVPSLYSDIRHPAEYTQSLDILRYYRKQSPAKTKIKTGLMVGLGETKDELIKVFQDVYDAGTDILTIGQYLQSGKESVSVKKYYTKDEFKQMKSAAREIGISSVLAGPYVRSSYLANEVYMGTLEKNV
ncbi:MAG: lipoyl synthase [Spirochaetia bacterium]